jgi:hypothetical protein
LPPTPALPLAGGGSAPALDAATGQATLDNIQRLLDRLIAAHDAAIANGLPSPQSARTLATLAQIVALLNRVRGGAPTDTGPIDDDDDDMPADIDEFRRDLARRIDAFVASRTDAGDDRGDAGPAPLDAVR